MRRGDKHANAEEAALCVARSPEGRAAVQKAAAATRPLTSEEEYIVLEQGERPSVLKDPVFSQG